MTPPSLEKYKSIMKGEVVGSLGAYVTQQLRKKKITSIFSSFQAFLPKSFHNKERDNFF